MASNFYTHKKWEFAAIIAHIRRSNYYFFFTDAAFAYTMEALRTSRRKANKFNV
jgi:hypothetical protein